MDEHEMIALCMDEIFYLQNLSMDASSREGIDLTFKGLDTTTFSLSR
jgi:hypothetical protein